MTALRNKYCSGHRKATEDQRTWKRDLVKEMWASGFRYSWRKVEVAAQDRTGWRQVVSVSDKA